MSATPAAINSNAQGGLFEMTLEEPIFAGKEDSACTKCELFVPFWDARDNKALMPVVARPLGVQFPELILHLGM